MATVGKVRVVFNWSGGKDSSLALFRLLKDDRYEVASLLTSMSHDFRRVSQHGVRLELMLEQARSLEIPFSPLFLPGNPDMETYNRLMHEKLKLYREEGITTAVFGDIFLEDLRLYREEQLDRAGMSAVFPLWKEGTEKLAQEFISLGFKAIVVCVDNRKLHSSFAGREYNNSFLADLPAGIDPCGENGEFHTFVYEGPIFRTAVKFKRGETVFRKYTPPGPDAGMIPGREAGSWFCDLLPAGKES